MDTKINILLIGDNNENAPWHPLEPASVQLEAILGDAFQLTVTEDYSKLAELSQADYAAVIAYTDCWYREPKAEETAGLIRFVAGGGGLLAIHNGISLQTSYELAQLIGAKFVNHPPYQSLNYFGAAEGHALLEGVPDFTMDEEPFMYEFDSFTPRNVFLEYEFEGNRYPAAWEHSFGLGKVVFLKPGHHAASFEPEPFRTLIRNSLRWVSNQEK